MQRAVVVVSGAGEGKSTLSALLCAAADSGVGGYHFIKYSDQRRLEPLRVIRTLAFQLAHRCVTSGMIPGSHAQLPFPCMHAVEMAATNKATTDPSP